MGFIHLQRSTGNAKMLQAVRHNGLIGTQAANQNNADYIDNYITPNNAELGHMASARSTTESTDEIYTDSRGNYYLKLVSGPTKEPNHYQDYTDSKGNFYVKLMAEEPNQYLAIIDETIKLYDVIREPQYETLIGESSESSQYMEFRADQDSEQQPQYLDVVGDDSNEEIYSDISQVQENDNQKLSN